MNSPKEILFATLKHEETGEIPWVPFAGVHAGKLVEYNATEVLTDGDKLFEALMAVNRLYKPNGQPVVFDLQIEAEILGCELVWAKESPPSVKTHPCPRPRRFRACAPFRSPRTEGSLWF